jgi:hypothetical protein
VKIDLEFFLDGAKQSVCRAWPAIPRVGDIVSLADEFGENSSPHCEVYRVEWEDSADEDLRIYKNRPYIYVFLRPAPRPENHPMTTEMNKLRELMDRTFGPKER